MNLPQKFLIYRSKTAKLCEYMEEFLRLEKDVTDKYCSYYFNDKEVIASKIASMVQFFIEVDGNFSQQQTKILDDNYAEFVKLRDGFSETDFCDLKHFDNAKMLIDSGEHKRLVWKMLYRLLPYAC